MRLSRYESAIRRWVAALNGRVDRERIEAAVRPEVRVDRYGFGANAGVLMQEIRGTQGVADWFGLSPAGVQIELAGPVEFEAAEPNASSVEGSPPGLRSSDATATPDGGSVARVRYQVSAPGFLGGGTWRFRAADDERIAWLEHHPDDLADAIEESRSRTGLHRDEHHHDDPHHVEHHH